MGVSIAIGTVLIRLPSLQPSRAAAARQATPFAARFAGCGSSAYPALACRAGPAGRKHDRLVVRDLGEDLPSGEDGLIHFTKEDMREHGVTDESLFRDLENGVDQFEDQASGDRTTGASESLSRKGTNPYVRPMSGVILLSKLGRRASCSSSTESIGCSPICLSS